MRVIRDVNWFICFIFILKVWLIFGVSDFYDAPMLEVAQHRG